jgi:signal peptidase II
VHHVQGSRRDSLDLAHPGRVFIATALIALAVDQLSKAMVRAAMVEQQSARLIPHVMNLTYVRNEGAAFGLFPGRQPVFIVTSALVLFVIAAFWRRTHPAQWPVVIALGLVAAGAVGNLIDRSILGYVTDFFEFGFVEFPVFNVADSCIVVGVAILMFWILFGPEDASDAVEDGGAALHAEDDAHVAADDTSTSVDVPSPPAEVDAGVSE